MHDIQFTFSKGNEWPDAIRKKQWEQRKKATSLKIKNDP